MWRTTCVSCPSSRLPFFQPAAAFMTMTSEQWIHIQRSVAAIMAIILLVVPEIEVIDIIVTMNW